MIGRSSLSISKSCINFVKLNRSTRSFVATVNFQSNYNNNNKTSNIVSYQQPYTFTSSRLYSTTTTTNIQQQQQSDIKKEEKVEEKKVDEQQGEGEKKQEEGEGEKKQDGESSSEEPKFEERILTPEEKKKKFRSNLKWGTVMSLLGATLGFLFYESHMRHTLPYRIVMRRVNADREALQLFGGTISELAWYQCFTKPIWGWTWIYEGATTCEAQLNIPIKRYIPPAPKPDETPKTPLPEEEESRLNDGGAQEGYVRATLVKNSPWFYDWKIQSLSIESDNGNVNIVTYKPLQYPKSRFDL
ncbi:hypothetical protein DFA_10120 [Cavenderia fasciculata]|uniref:Uncharacterized protein n=1 Tax=Cavenderia fasciculata TaxID=261658 RepID=F4Q9B7_CACFS|nr:uncharacterized protein DFA_10120 [Cavenderia fasciculata]EGG15286.1 hypothetical protein DFA_10120 [Cavenderia fasciculata]|eukprot:XP_004352006.1 hypothetical protein DFA_10120 [Cavenderia fasciculata]